MLFLEHLPHIVSSQYVVCLVPFQVLMKGYASAHSVRAAAWACKMLLHFLQDMRLLHSLIYVFSSSTFSVSLAIPRRSVIWDGGLLILALNHLHHQAWYKNKNEYDSELRQHQQLKKMINDNWRHRRSFQRLIRKINTFWLLSDRVCTINSQVSGKELTGAGHELAQEILSI